MTDDQPATDSRLLSLCAMLRWFDRDLLASFGEYTNSQIETLLASELIAIALGGDGAFQLRDDVKTEALARLRADHPSDELRFHEYAFAIFLQRMQRHTSSSQRMRDETTCFYHLGELRMLLMERREWQTLKQYIEATRSAAPQQEHHLHILTLYEGFIAIRTQEYDLGERILSELLEQAGLEINTQMLAANYLAQSQWYQAHYDRALALYQQSQFLAQSINNRWYQGASLLNMSLIYHEIGSYEQALDLSMQSLQIFQALRDMYREAHATYEIGKNAMQLGRWELAQYHFQQADHLYDTLGVIAQQANLYCLLGILYHGLGDEVQSESYYLRSLEIAQSPEHGDIAIAMDIWLYLGFLYQTQHRWDAALSTYDLAVSLAIQLRNQHTHILILYRLGNVFHRQGRLDDAFAAYTQAIDGIEALGSATESEEIKIGLLGTTQQIYEAIVLLCLELGRPADAFHYVERARSRAFLDTLVKKSPELYDVVAQPVVTLADVQAQLPAGALLLEYFTTGVLPSGEHMLNSIPESNARLREHLTLPPHVIVFAITRDHCDIHRPALNPNSLRPPVGDRYPGRHLLHGRLPQHLYDRLIAPASALLAGCTMLYLVPHGPLHYVPFTALHSANGAYLLHPNGPALAHAPSATILLRSCIGRPPTRATATLALGFNDPLGEQPLRYAEAEAQHVARILGGAAWVGADPKSERLIAAGRDIRWLHIAGHARFNPADPLGSELYLGSGDPLSARAIIRDLDLAAELVTLSSCTSGVSYVVPGDELLGLQRALLYAGAPTVLCTRWEARDLVSLLLMDLFYSALQQGRSAGLALRDAQIAVRELTGSELAALIERWNAPADLTLDAQLGTRALADMDLGAIRDMWRGEAPDLVDALDQPAVQPSTHESHPFADALFWAPFMLVGRA